MTFDLENTGGACGGTQAIRMEILERQADVEKEAERKKLELMKYIKEQPTLLLHYTNQLQQQQSTREYTLRKHANG